MIVTINSLKRSKSPARLGRRLDAQACTSKEIFAVIVDIAQMRGIDVVDVGSAWRVEIYDDVLRIFSDDSEKPAGFVSGNVEIWRADDHRQLFANALARYLEAVDTAGGIA